MNDKDDPLSYPFITQTEPGVHPCYAALRLSDSLVRVQMPYGEPAWLATRYEDVRCVHADPRFSRALAAHRDQPRAFPVMPEDSLQGMDPPDHGRLRRLASRVFSARRVERMRPLIQQLAEDLLDRMEAQGPPADLIADYGTPLTGGVITELFGVPREDRPRFAEWAKSVTSTTLPREQVEEHVGALQEYVDAMVDRCLREPSDDLIGVLVEGFDEGRVSRHEMVTLARLMLAAGHDSVNYQIGHCAYLLLTHPTEWARLVADPWLINSAVEELLRFEKTDELAVFPRYAVEDVQLSTGKVCAGDPVLPSRISANHDERVFDDPDRLDLGREHNPHLAFGHGPHHCPGAPLARAELQIAIGSLVERLPGMRLAVAETELEWESAGLARELRTLPITW
ncbi:cytochrome P450 [Streptomyces collinus]|uniref:cytochrome P450 n=1 Tax=Streptomyces collinus TaxID=42684 RepID=UPI0029437196|nr:cytochrome P450 [Streptomyces collinus]